MLKTLLIGSIMTSSLLVAGDYVENLNENISYNTHAIAEYQKAIKELEKKNKTLNAIKTKNPELYQSKPLYEDTKTAYIYRIKLNGATAKALNVTIKNHVIAVEMSIKEESNTDHGYYSRSENFYKSFSIPKEVNESAISNAIKGDYFEIVMPKVVIPKKVVMPKVVK